MGVKTVIAVCSGLLVVFTLCTGVMYHELASERQDVAALKSQLAATGEKLTGQRQDVITCNDLRHLAMDGISSDGAQVGVGYENGGGTNGVALPSHCYNP